MIEDRRCYTLLADDSSAYSRHADQRNAFLAHLVYSAIVNGHIVFSDNQIIGSPNLRNLAAGHSTIRAGFEEGLFSLAVRADFNGSRGLASLAEVHEAFVREAKLERHPELKQFSSELVLLESRAQKIPWPYPVVRTNFTQRCHDLLHDRFRERLNPDQHRVFMGLIEAEMERDQGLGREFLQYGLIKQMRRKRLPTPRDTSTLLQQCIDAPYVSNLPITLGLNPIYATEHEASFKLLRGNSVFFHDFSEPRAEERRLPYRHFVAGLLQLDLDDIQELQDTRAATSYRKLQRQALLTVADVTAIEDAFFALNTEIEEKIYDRVFRTRRSQRTGELLDVRRQYATRFQHGANVAIDVVGIVASTYFGGIELGAATKVVLDVARSNTALGALTTAISDHIAAGPMSSAQFAKGTIVRKQAALEEHYRQIEQSEKIEIVEMVQTDSFDKETVIG